jgi:hypothetical protein
MTKKHFNEIARILTYASNKTHPALFSKMVNDFAEMCAKDNPAFNVTTFHKACNYNVPKFTSR